MVLGRRWRAVRARWTVRSVSARRPRTAPAGTCDWGNCDKPAIAWRRNGSRQLGEYLPVCAEHVQPVDDPPDYQTATLDAPAPEHGTPAWHIDQAVEHLAKADQLASTGSPQGAMVRALAATANAQIAAAKLALEGDAMLADLLGQVRQLNTHAEFVAIEVDRLDVPRRG